MNLPTPVRRLLVWMRSDALRLATFLFVVLSVPLTFNVVLMKDVVSFTNSLQRTWQWGFPLNYNFKFGVNIIILGAFAQFLAPLLHLFGVTAERAVIVSWKIPLIAASIASAYLVRAIARLCQLARPNVPAVLFLLAPSTLFLGPGYGEIEIFATVCALGATYLYLRGRWEWATVLVVMGAGCEYWPIACLLIVVVSLARAPHLLRSLRFLRVVVILTVGLALQFADLYIGGGLSTSLARTVVPVQGIGQQPGPSSPFSLWIFGGHEWGYRGWLGLVLVLAVGLFVEVVFIARRLEEHVAVRLGVVMSGVFIVMTTALDPRSNVQYSEILVTGVTLIVAVVGGAESIIAIVGAGCFAFISAQPMYDLWSALATKGAGHSWSPGSNHALTIVIIVVAVVAATGLLVSVPRLWRRRRGTVSSVERFSRQYLAAPLIEIGVIVAVLSAQPGLWSGTFTQVPRATNNYVALDSFQAPNAQQVFDTSTEVAFSPAAVALQHSTTVHPSVEANLAINANGNVPLFVAGPTQSTGKSCQRTLTLYQHPDKTYPGVTSFWVVGETSGQPWNVNTNFAFVHHRSVDISPPLTALTASQVRFAFQLSGAQISGKSNLLRGDCGALTGIGQYLHIYPVRGVAYLEINNHAVSMAYAITSDGTGTGTLHGFLSDLNVYNNVLNNLPMVSVSEVGLRWPSNGQWLAPLWTTLLDIAVVLAGVLWWRRRR